MSDFSWIQDGINSKGAKRYWREGEDAYQFAILADAALSAVPSDSPADVKTAGPLENGHE